MKIITPFVKKHILTVTKSFWLFALVIAQCPALPAQDIFAGSSTSLFPPMKKHRLVHSKVEQEGVTALVQLIPQTGDNAEQRKRIVIALARLGAIDVALSIAKSPSLQNEVKQMATFRSIFVGTTTTAKYWLSQLPVNYRAEPKLQLARRLLLEKQPQKALEILHVVSSTDSTEVSGDVALAFAEAGNVAEAQRRFESLDTQLKKSDTRDEGLKQLVGSERGRLAVFRLRAGLPLSAQQLVAQGKHALIYSFSFYLDTYQEAALREILELLPPKEALGLLSPDGNLVVANEKANDIRHRLVHDWLSKIPIGDRKLYVEIEARELVMANKPMEAMKIIEDFLPATARQPAENMVRLWAILYPQSRAKLSLDTRKVWEKRLLQDLQSRRRQQLREPDERDVLYQTLSLIFEVALVLGQNQVAQNALYEREKLPLDQWNNEEGKDLRAETFSTDWHRLGNKQRADLWQQKMRKEKPQKSTLGRLWQAMEDNKREDVRVLLPHVSTKEWERVQIGDIYEFVSIDSSGAPDEVPTQLPIWFANLATVSQKVEALSQWLSRIAPWEGMRWARVEEKMK